MALRDTSLQSPRISVGGEKPTRKMSKTGAIGIIDALLREPGKPNIFRGQGSHWPLLPKALRPEFKEGQHEEAIDVFRRGCVAAGYEATGELIDLAVAQHYGLATNLLDWTTNPIVALFFACSENQDEDGEVFILNKQESVSVDEEEGDNWKDIQGLKFYNPPIVDDRIARQKGLFTIQAKDKRAVREIVGGSPELDVISIPAGLKNDLVELLYTMGIDRSTLFPGLDGLCDRINWETKNRITRDFPPVSKARVLYLSANAKSASFGNLHNPPSGQDWRWNALQPRLEKTQPPFWKLLSVASRSHEGPGVVVFTFLPRDKAVFETLRQPSAEHEALRHECRSVRIKVILRCGDEEIVFDETRLN
jgi:FRG domain-containing protein